MPATKQRVKKLSTVARRDEAGARQPLPGARPMDVVVPSATMHHGRHVIEVLDVIIVG